MKLLTKTLEQRFVTVGSQKHVKDPMIIAKFFNPCGAGTWYATEYHPEDQTFFGYVTGLGSNEWGYFSLVELQHLKLPFGLGIERDLHFGEQQYLRLYNQKNMNYNVIFTLFYVLLKFNLSINYQFLSSLT